MAGRYSDGWLAGMGRLYLWPERTGGDRAAREPDPDGASRRGRDDDSLRSRAGPRSTCRSSRAAGDGRFDVCSRGLADDLQLADARLRRQPCRQRSGELSLKSRRSHAPETHCGCNLGPETRERRDLERRRLAEPSEPTLEPRSTRSRRLPLALAALFCVATAYHWLQSRGHVTPAIFTDELMFSELARVSRRATADRAGSLFPAFLPALVQAPVWLLDGAAAYGAAKRSTRC